MFWLLFFLIALCALAYRRASITTSAWVMAGVIVFYGIIGSSIVLFLLLVLVWVIVCVPLMIPVLRQEWLSRPLLDRLRTTLGSLPAETRAALDSDDDVGCDAPLLGGAPDWPALRAMPAPAISELQRTWLDSVVDPACTILAQTPADASARNRLCAAALSASHDSTEDEQPDGDNASRDERSTAVLRAAACARAAGALGTVAWPLCSPLRAGWLELLRVAANEGQSRDGLAHADTVLEMLAVAFVGPDPAREACGWAVLSTASTGQPARAGLDISLRNGLRADHAAKHYALLLDFHTDRSTGGSTCVILDAETPGLNVHTASDGHVLLRGDAVRAPLSALVFGVRGIGHGGRQLAAAIATARAIHAPALRLGQALPLALASGWRARLHAPGEQPTAHHGAVRSALAATAAELFAANALRELTLAELDQRTSPIGLAAIAELRVASIGERIFGRARSLARGGALEQLAQAPPRAVSLYANSLLGLRVLGRCHPPFHRQWQAARTAESATALQDFDTAYWSHAGYLLSNGVRALLASLGAGALLPVAGLDPIIARCLRRVDRACISLALLVDLNLFARRRRLLQDDSLLTALGDAVSRLELAKAVIWKTEQDTDHPATAALLRTAVAQALDATLNDCEVMIRTLPAPLRGVARLLTTPFGRWRLPRGNHDTEILTTWLCDGDAARYFRTLLPATLPDAAQRLRRAVDACRNGEALTARLPGTGTLPCGRGDESIAAAQSAGRIDATEAQRLRDWARLCEAAQSEAMPSGPANITEVVDG